MGETKDAAETAKNDKPTDEKKEEEPKGPLQEKEFSDDTDTYGEDSEHNPEVHARRQKRHRRHLYKDFIIEHEKFWKTFNGLCLFFSIGFLVGTWLILEHDDRDCGSLKLVLYMVIALHGANIFMSLLNLAKFETKVCN